MCNTNTNQCKCWSIAKRHIFKLLLNIVTHHLAENIFLGVYQNSQKFTFYPEHIKNPYLYNIHLDLRPLFQIIQERVNKMCTPLEQNFSNKIFEPFLMIKLINHTPFKICQKGNLSYAYKIVSNVNKVVDCINFLHIDYTIQWHYL